jgi:hypothetical protein
MMSDTALLLGIASGLIALLGFLALALAYIRGAYSKATMESLRLEVEDSARREQRLKEELVECRAQISALTERVAVLGEQVTQRAAVEAMRAQQQANHTEMMESLGRIELALGRQNQ